MLTFRMLGSVLDVKSSFLNGAFENNEEIYMEVRGGFEYFYFADLLIRDMSELTLSAEPILVEVEKKL